jgi:ferric-dicitrate binding protein FerR (iron transport regulator)
MLCDRTREWVALRQDAELSEFETAIMTSHLERCDECLAFAADVTAITREIRSTPLEPLPRPIELGGPRRFPLPRRHLQVAAAAALVVVAAGLGSLYGALRATGSAEQAAAQLIHAPMVGSDDTKLLREIRLAELRPFRPLSIGAAKPVLTISL